MSMQIKNNNRFLFALVCVVGFSFHQAYALITYIPEDLRKCLRVAYEVAEGKSNVLGELYAMVNEGRVLASEKMVHDAIRDAATYVKQSRMSLRSKNAISDYLDKYDASLNEKRTVLLQLEGSDSALVEFSQSALARAENLDSVSRDLICVSQFSSANVVLNGDAAIDCNLPQSTRSANAKPSAAGDPSILFNAAMLTSAQAPTPNVVFGTGVGQTVVTAWSMAPSTTSLRAPSSMPIPVNMQFSIPNDLKTEKPISLQLHFLVQKTSSSPVTGKARMQIDGLYIKNKEQFNTADVTSTSFSHDFYVVEPSNSADLVHLYITVDLHKHGIKKNDLAILSISRIAPCSGIEYPGNLNLVAATFQYTSTNS
jgi:hypothetical protein